MPEYVCGQFTHSHFLVMNTRQRLDRALQIRAALQDLMTPEESDTYEDLDNHFCDYIRDLTIDHQNTLPSLPAI